MNQIITTRFLVGSRFATREECQTAHFKRIACRMEQINCELRLPDHSTLNRERFPWAVFQGKPEFYASRLWEYPWCILATDPQQGMVCVDVGCGTSPFCPYLSQLGCEVIGVDSEFGSPITSTCHGVSYDWPQRAGIRMLASDASRLALPSNFADRVYCISVLEHIQSAYQRVQAVQEIHRILKPGGLAAITIDVHFQHEIVNPLSLAWHSGMDLEGTTSLCLPKDRFTFFKEVVPPQSCDVFGLLLRKPYGPVTYGSPAVELSPLQLSIWRYTNSEEEKRRFYVAQNLHDRALNGSLRAAFKLILLGAKDALRGLRYRLATTRKLER